MIYARIRRLSRRASTILDAVGHRDQLLAAARRLLEERGYAHITARDLVAASDTNLASIGYHFGSKAALLNAAIEASFDDWAGQLAAYGDVRAGRDTAGAGRRHLGRRRSSACPSGGTMLQAYVEALAQALRVPELREPSWPGTTAGPGRWWPSSWRASLGDGAGRRPTRAVAPWPRWSSRACDGLAMQWLLDPDGAPRAGGSRRWAGGRGDRLAATRWRRASYRPPEISRTAGRTSAR